MWCVDQQPKSRSLCLKVDGRHYKLPICPFGMTILKFPNITQLLLLYHFKKYTKRRILDGGRREKQYYAVLRFSFLHYNSQTDLGEIQGGDRNLDAEYGADRWGRGDVSDDYESSDSEADSDRHSDLKPQSDSVVPKLTYSNCNSGRDIDAHLLV